jgi:hypothetical protein
MAEVNRRKSLRASNIKDFYKSRLRHHDSLTRRNLMGLRLSILNTDRVFSIRTRSAGDSRYLQKKEGADNGKLSFLSITKEICLLCFNFH